MIDWLKVLSNSVWLIGLAMLLAVFSYQSYASGAVQTARKAGSSRLLAGVWAHLGALLFCAGMALARGAWLERGLWLLLALAVLYDWWRPVAPARAVTGAPPGTPWNDGVTAAAGDQLQGLQADAAGGRDSGVETLRAQRPKSRLSASAEWLIKGELLWLGLLSPFFLFPAPDRVLALLGLPLLWVIRRLARGHFVPRTPVDWAIALLMLTVLVSLYATPDMSVSLSKISLILFGIGLYYAIVDWVSSDDRLWRAALGYAYAGAAIAALGLLGTIWITKFPFLNAITARLPALLRSTTADQNGFNPNIVGGALLWVLPVQIVLLGGYLMNRSSDRVAPWLQRTGLVVGATFAISTLLLTQSRNALASFGAASVLLLWLAGRWGRLALAAALVVGAAVTLLVGTRTLRNIVSDTGGRGVSVANGVASAEVRVEVWARAVYAIEDFPLTGTGMGIFKQVMPLLYPIPDLPPDVTIEHAHNQFLQAAIDLGLPGLVGYLAVWLVGTYILIQAWRTSISKRSRMLAAGVGAGWLASLIFSMSDTVMFVARPSIFFWGLLGLLVALWQQNARKLTRI